MKPWQWFTLVGAAVVGLWFVLRRGAASNAVPTVPGTSTPPTSTVAPPTSVVVPSVTQTIGSAQANKDAVLSSPWLAKFLGQPVSTQPVLRVTSTIPGVAVHEDASAWAALVPPSSSTPASAPDPAPVPAVAPTTSTPTLINLGGGHHLF